MMRNTGSSAQYICIYATICGVTSLLALYGTMEHLNKGTSKQQISNSNNIVEADAVTDSDIASQTTTMVDRDYHGVDFPMDTTLRAIDAKMQRVLENASAELTNFGRHVTDWDKRKPSKQNSVLLVSSSHPRECENAHGDHVLLKSLKNKVDYCRLHGMELYYNMDMLDDKMAGWWVKLFLIRMLMLERPDVEWILWMDSDAVFTNMTFKLPLEKYKEYNMVVQGSEESVYKQKSWLGLNSGVILLRNCQWSIDLLHEWARFSPKGKIRDGAGALLSEAFPDRPQILEADDQCALIYLLLTQRSRWGPEVYLEHSYHLQGFFEVMTMYQSTFPGMGLTWWPVITHFTGCQFCCGLPNTQYDVESCHRHMELAYKVANNQVLHHSGYSYVSLQSSVVKHS
ncbi:hypothetical protein KC19_1G253100 [Ceratodon purpureus]|uniref:Uncharacterized protein n=1 Tax=Ceratodon purpureus TaxID=3225 RepID=A0A8T0JAZ4_CERPU|nr:hypothetical protein KC19_1G253100 [Ceratodon purpureus]